MIPDKQPTAFEIREALARKYRTELFIPEFRDKPAEYSHMIDALAIWLHPSRSKSVECFEIKTSRADWLSELDSPLKSDSIAKHCDHVWLVTSDDKIAKIEEIPESWGWMYLKGKRLKIIKNAPDLKPIFDRDFVITVAQYVKEKFDFLITDAENRGHQKGYKSGKESSLPEDAKRSYEYRTKELERYEKLFNEIQRITGKDFRWENVEGIKEIMTAVLKMQELREKYDFDSLENRLEDIQKKLDTAKDSVSKLKKTTELLRPLR